MQCDPISFFISPFSFPFIASEQIPENTGPPLDLWTSEVTARSFQVSWSHAPGNVEKYRVVYYPLQGGLPQEVNAKFFAHNTTVFTVLKNSLTKSNQKEQRKSRTKKCITT